MPVRGGVCGGDDEEDEDDDPPDARRADHVEGTSRPSGETQPMPVTATLRRGGASDWAGMLVPDGEGEKWTAHGLTLTVSVSAGRRFCGGLREARQARDRDTIAFFL